MHRHIVYPGQIPLDTDLLNAIQDAYYGVGWLAESILGTGTVTVGLAVAPTVPASLQVTVAPGAIYSLQTVDGSAYGSLGTDSNQFLKQGLSKTSQTLTITPPSTTGYSQNYLVQVAFTETDTAAITLPYYNASNPSVAWNGPNNSGSSQNTIRQDNCVISLKAGVPAATGSQTTPAPDAGNTGLYVITVANGQTTITSGNISLLTSAPIFTTLPQIPAAIQNSQFTYAVAGGTANAITATLAPVPAAYVAGLRFSLKISNTNMGATTVNLNGLGNISVVGDGSVALSGGELVAGNIVDFICDGTNVQIVSRKTGRLLRTSLYFMSGGVQQVSINGGAGTTTGASTFTPLTPTTTIEVEVIGGGGGGAGGGGQGAGTYSLGGGGGGGAWGWGIYPAQPATITIGTGGLAGTAAPTAGGNGNSSSFGSLVTAPGGFGGPTNNSISSPVVSQSAPGASIATGGIINAPGGAALPGAASSGGNFAGGGGANGKGNPGPGQPGLNTAGFNAVAPGTGGSGADVGPSSGGLVGGTGASGQILVKEYA